MFQICLQLTGVWGVRSSMAASEFGVHVSVCWCLHWAYSVCCITLTLEPPFHKQGELPLEGLSQCPEFLSGALLFSPFSCRVAFEWPFQRGTRGLVQKKCPTHNPPPPPLPKPLHPTPSRSWHNSKLPQAPLPPTTSSRRLRQSRGWRAGRNGCWGSTVMGWCDLWRLFRCGGGGCWRKGLCVAMPAQGGTFYDCVAGGISWIRLQLRETPCGRMEVSAQGHSSMNSLHRTTSSTPRTNRSAKTNPSQWQTASTYHQPALLHLKQRVSFIQRKSTGSRGKYVAISTVQF